MSKKRKKNLLSAAAEAAKPAETSETAPGARAPVEEQKEEAPVVQEPAAPAGEAVAGEEQAPQETAAEQPAESEQAEAPEVPQPDIPDAPASAPDVQENAQPKEPEQPKVAEPPPKVTVVQEQPVDITKTQTRKVVMSSDLLPKPRNPIAARRESPVKLPPGAVRLNQLFDEYEGMLAVKSDEARECERRVKKLYELMNAACSVVNIRSEPATNAMIKIVFDSLMKGWGKFYSEKTMFKRDYTLNNTSQIDRFNAFWVAMIQLVQAATECTRVSFDPRALMDVIKNETVTKVIVRFRDAIVERNDIQASNKPL